MSALPSLGAAWLVVLASGLCACAAPAGEADSEQARGAIIGGAKDTGDPAVVLLASYPADHTTLDTCTASFLSDTVLLTAAHCVDSKKHPDYSFGVFLGPDASAYGTANTLIPQLLAVKEVHAHPEYDPAAPFHADIGVVILEKPAAVAPLPIQREPVSESLKGQAARIVGYGQIKYKEYNAIRYQASTVVATVEADDTLTVGDLDHRSCIGDSGGPALVVIDGEERIVGVDSYTELSGCLEPAHYRRTDLYTAFLDTYVPPPDTGTGGTGGATTGTSTTTGTGGSTQAPKGGGCHIAPAPSGSANGAWTLALLMALAFLRRTSSQAHRTSSQAHRTISIPPRTS